MTDENVEIEPVDSEFNTEWTETPGGYAQMSIDLDDDVVDEMVNIWVEKNLHPPSVELYNEQLSAETKATALRNAVINDQIIEALTKKIEEAEADAESEEV